MLYWRRTFWHALYRKGESKIARSMI